MFTSIVIMTLVLLAIASDVRASWAWEWDRNNYTPMRRHSRIPHVGVRRSIYDRFWGETTPNNPFLPTRPSAPRVLPRLSENDFITHGDDDYDEDFRNPHWLPQYADKQQTKSLEGLQHILEGRVDSTVPTGHQRKPSVKDEKEKKQRKKERKFKQRFSHELPLMSSNRRPNASFERTSDSNFHQMPDFGDSRPFIHHDRGHLVKESQKQFSKDSMQDFQDPLEPLSMPDHLTNNKAFSNDFITSEHFPSQFELLESSPSNDHLSTDPFVNTFEAQEPLMQEHLIFDPLSNDDGFQSSDHILNLDADQTLGEVDLPQLFPDLEFLDTIDQPETFIDQDYLGHFALPNAQVPDILPESDGEGLSWLPPALSDLNLPSHSHMMANQQRLSKEAHREACHARNLHSCGSRLIDEFAFGPGDLDRCRIREEFLDCMEQVMKLPCELHGERYSREGTKLIRDKIKNLLWSAQGCILGYST